MTLPILETVTVGSPIERCGISLFPLYLPENELPAIATGEASGLVIDELDTASVQALRATNPTDKPVLLVEGEHFLGGKQNRAVNASVLVDSMSSLDVPVSCLEQGRWGSRQAWRRAEAFAPARVRATKRAGVSRSMRVSGSRLGDQDGVWEEVGATLRSEGGASPGGPADAGARPARCCVPYGSGGGSGCDRSVAILSCPGRRETRGKRPASGTVRHRSSRRTTDHVDGSFRCTAFAGTALGKTGAFAFRRTLPGPAGPSALQGPGSGTRPAFRMRAGTKHARCGTRR